MFFPTSDELKSTASVNRLLGFGLATFILLPVLQILLAKIYFKVTNEIMFLNGLLLQFFYSFATHGPGFSARTSPRSGSDPAGRQHGETCPHN